MRTLLVCLLRCGASAAAAQGHGRLHGGSGVLRYAVSRDNKPVIAPSALGLGSTCPG